MKKMCSFLPKILIVSMFAVAMPYGYSKEIAITFDDAPRSSTQLFNGTERAKRLIANLKKAEVPQVAFFANTERFDEEGVNRMKMYVKAEHLIGNHTHNHPDFNNTDLKLYLESIQQAHKVLSSFPNFVPLFRFPFLREGPTTEKRDGARAVLGRLRLSNAYITIENYDWHMDWLLQKALKEKKKVDYEKLRTAYLDVLLECVKFYDEMALHVLGRSPSHVFLLHENDINALFIADLVAALRQLNWKIITPQHAYKDEIASYQTKTIFKHNPGRIGEIAKDRGYSGDLWHESCDEGYLNNFFAKRKVFNE